MSTCAAELIAQIIDDYPLQSAKVNMANDKETRKIIKNKEVCPICLESFEKEKDIFLTTCSHFFHKSCIKNGIMIIAHVAEKTLLNVNTKLYFYTKSIRVGVQPESGFLHKIDNIKI